MGDNIIFSNEYLRIFLQNDGIYIETFKKGLPSDQLSSILANNPQIGVTSMNVLRNAINLAPRAPEKFAELRENMTICISDTELTASIVFNMTSDALALSSRDSLRKEALELLKEKGIVYGIKADIFNGEIISGKSYVIAEGLQPVNGDDAIINMYQLLEAKPEVREDGRVDFYELKLINRIKAGSWLGERIEATEGFPGKTVKGNVIKPVKGRTYQLNYDRNSVQEIFDNHKTTLYARINGAVSYTNGKISVSNHLEIDGDVGLATGNLKFDGFVTIKGTVNDGFSVEATKDIEINGELGLGTVKHIISSEGSIYIRGGISAKDRVEIKAANNVFIKFTDNSHIVCNGSLHIGYYCLNSNLSAKEIVMDASDGKIIGGHIKAEIRVSAPIIGSDIEKKTVIEVTGFNRSEMLHRLDVIFRNISELRSEQQKKKMVVSSMDGTKQLDNFKRKEYNDANERLFAIRDEIKKLEEDRKSIAGYLKTHGEGEITAAKRIYPNCTLILNRIVMDINNIMNAPTFYIQEGAIKQL